MNSAFIQMLPDLQCHTTGQLAHLKFAVKDLIDVQNTITGGGNPSWRKLHTAAKKNAPCVQQLLDQGAILTGKTITDELAYSLEGHNYFYGTPINPRWPSALPGGSSSGSASAVAQGLVDFSLGTDTGGSVRVPAAFCGLWGIRPSHDVISTQGVIAFAPRFDTVGWLSQDKDIFKRVGEVLLPSDLSSINLEDLPLLGVAEAFDYRQHNSPEQAVEIFQVCQRLGMQKTTPILNRDPKQWLACYQYLQDHNIKTALGEWIKNNHPEFGPEMDVNFRRVLANTGDQIEHFETEIAIAKAHINTIVNKNILILPTTPLALVPKDINPQDLYKFYQQALTINAIAAFAGLPQVNIPIAQHDDYPISISIIGPRYSDRQLINLASSLYQQAHSNQVIGY
ncbi:amidase family protein [Acinetobacter puyangensis]|uniref:amidase family protein n=1 Tax=Acinetobacter puyangensis TaxID=1096779 RepID=UPI003A4D9EAD